MITPPNGKIFFEPTGNNEGIVVACGGDTEVNVGDRIKFAKGKSTKLELSYADGRDLNSIMESHIYFVYGI